MVFISMIDCSEIKTEQHALDVIEELMDGVDEISSMQPGGQKKRQVKLITSKLETLRKKCFRKRWKAPLMAMKQGFVVLKDCRQECDNIWSMMFEV